MCSIVDKECTLDFEGRPKFLLISTPMMKTFKKTLVTVDLLIATFEVHN